LDSDFYENPGEYRPFRFVVPQNEDSQQQSSGGPSKGKYAVTLDDSFLGFGCGKHACPGRFFAVHEMKLVVAHLLLNYEVEYLKDHPPLKNFMWLKLPLNNVQIRVRKLSDDEKFG
jgi:cytochrome P450